MKNILLLLLPVSIASCSLTKKITRSNSDSTKTNRVDSGVVNKRELSTRSDAEWWREIVNYDSRDVGRSKDSVYVERTLKPQNNYYTQPIQIIREGGTVATVSNQINYDSIWNNKMDSLTVRLSGYQKDSKTNALSIWHLLGIAIVGGVVMVLIQRIPFRIVRK